MVNTHLTPHDNNIDKRIADYYSIIGSQTFQSEKISSILDHDLLFWFGDLNFRLEPKSYSTSEVIQHVSKQNMDPLIAFDELNQLLSGTSAFSGFSECEINFKPTYKLIPHSQEVYDEK